MSLEEDRTTTGSSRARPRVVIVGAGFGGLWAARGLARAPVEVVLIDRNNYHTFLPLLYQVAAAELNPEDIVYPVRSTLRRQTNADFVLGEVVGIDLAARSVKVKEAAIPYDFLIVAGGSAPHFFGVPGAAEHAFALKTLHQGIRLRNQILGCFERAALAERTEERRGFLTFVIVGGGPTGLEFAGALAELLRGPLERDFAKADLRKARVVLLEAADSLLPGLPERLRSYALVRLRRMGVEVRLGAAVTEVTALGAKLKDGSELPTSTVVWTAGVRGHPLAGAWGLPVGRGGRVTTLPTLQLEAHLEVYIVGDLVYLETGGRPLPMLAPVAIQQGRAAAENIKRALAGRPPTPFRYRDPGTLATIGRNAAVAEVGGHLFTGFPAWVLWLSVHLFNLIGFRNRLVVMINWAWDYFLYERVGRLILGTEIPNRA